MIEDAKFKIGDKVLVYVNRPDKPGYEGPLPIMDFDYDDDTEGIIYKFSTFPFFASESKVISEADLQESADRYSTASEVISATVFDYLRDNFEDFGLTEEACNDIGRQAVDRLEENDLFVAVWRN